MTLSEMFRKRKILFILGLVCLINISYGLFILIFTKSELNPMFWIFAIVLNSYALFRIINNLYFAHSPYSLKNRKKCFNLHVQKTAELSGEMVSVNKYEEMLNYFLTNSYSSKLKFSVKFTSCFKFEITNIHDPSDFIKGNDGLICIRDKYYFFEKMKFFEKCMIYTETAIELINLQNKIMELNGKDGS